MNDQLALYQQVILEHNRKPRNFREIMDHSHHAEGFNPLCGDHLWVYILVNDNEIKDISFQGNGCAISKASASMMTMALKGKNLAEADKIFKDFQGLLSGKLKPDSQDHCLGRLKIFENIWKYPSRIKCANLAWHAMNGAIHQSNKICTE